MEQDLCSAAPASATKSPLRREICQRIQVPKAFTFLFSQLPKCRPFISPAQTCIGQRHVSHGRAWLESPHCAQSESGSPSSATSRTVETHMCPFPATDGRAVSRMGLVSLISQNIHGVQATWLHFGVKTSHLSTALSFPRWSGSVAQKRSHGRWRWRAIRRLLAPVPLACRCRLDCVVTLSRVTYGCAAILASSMRGIARLVACCCETHVLSVGWLPGMAAYNHGDPLSVSRRMCSKEAKRLLFVRRTRPLRLLLAWILNPLAHRTGLTKSGSSLAVAPVCHDCHLTHMSFHSQRRWTCGFLLHTTSQRGHPRVASHAPQLSLGRCAFVSAGRSTTFGSCTLELRSANCKMLPRVLRRGLDQGWLQLVMVVTASFLRSRCRLAPACVRVLIGSPQSRLVLSVAASGALGRQTFHSCQLETGSTRCETLADKFP